MEYEQNRIFSKIARISILIPLLITLICIYSFVLLYSAAGGNFYPWASKQIIVFCIFMPISLLIALIDIRTIYKSAYFLYVVSTILLILVPFIGKSAMGATRWIDLGLFTIQPSEISKIAVILMLSRYFHDHNNSNLESSNLLIPAIASLIPICLTIKQPDLGTGVITFIVTVAMFFSSGVKIRYFVTVAITLITSMPIIWLLMHNYQKMRVLTFLYPERDPLGAGYNIIQSKIAIGSGGLFGKGLFSGTQSHLSFLPEYQTDFIFAFLAEEFGFVGGVVLLLLYGVLIFNTLLISINCRSKFAMMMIVGMITLFFSHIFINIAMVMGLLPVVGVPLPLMSYGRTMMASLFLGFGLIMNATIHQKNNI